MSSNLHLTHHQVLARKWRPKRFSDVVGQSNIIQSLQNSLKKKRMAHAYLLTGTRGVGKTTIARVLAKALNCQNLDNESNPCLLCESCKAIEKEQSLDVVELDAASHNSVEDIRILIENVQYLPSSGMYKIYILDEVHMLSKEAFNSLLKTLEDPPAYVVFIFATTVPDKIPDTILSRCIRFDFYPLSKELISLNLKKVLDAEGVKITDFSICEIIAEEGNGSFRDALSLLERILSFSVDGIIDERTVESSLGIPERENIIDICEALLTSDPFLVSKIFRSMIATNVQVTRITKIILNFFYQYIVHYQNPAILEEKKILKKINLRNFSLAELFFIYEGLAKDFNWSMVSPFSTEVTEIILQKYSFRKSFFHLDKVDLKQNIPEQHTIVEAAKENEVPPQPQWVNTNEWENIVNFFQTKSPILASQLEQGNLLQSINNSDSSVRIDLAFMPQSEIILSHLKEKELWQKIVYYLGEYLKRRPEDIDLQMSIVPTDLQGVFLPVSQMRTNRQKQKIKEREDNLKEHPTILEAQQIFNTTIEKIYLNQKELT